MLSRHTSRIWIRDQDLSSDDAFEALLEQIRIELEFAVQRVMTAEVDYMVMGMSAETFWGGVEGNREFIQQTKEWSGLDVVTGAEACEKALHLFGARIIGVVTAYQPLGVENVILFFNDIGFVVVNI